MQELEIQFLSLFEKYGNAEQAKKCWTILVENYTEEGRHYHDLNHIAAMIQEVSKISEIQDQDAMLFSIFYHDVIYDATRQDNESASAEMLRAHHAETTFDRVEKCIEQIERTKLHEASGDFDTDTLLDADLSILGKSAEIYKNYATAIRAEYQIYPDQLYYPGRKAVLEKMLTKPQLYKTAYFIEKYEQQARQNLSAEIESLADLQPFD